MHEAYNACGFIADSGNGYHLFFPLKTFPLKTLELNDTAFRIKINDQLGEFSKKLSMESECEFDTTHDLRRITQPIGGWNMKISGNPLETKWLDMPSDDEIDIARERNIDLLIAILTTEILNEKEDEQNDDVNRIGTYNQEPQHYCSLEFDMKRDIPMKQRFELLLMSDPKVSDLYYGNWQKYGFKSARSGAEQSLVSKLFMEGFNEGEIRTIMNGCRIGKWQNSQENYKEITLRKARKFAESHNVQRIGIDYGGLRGGTKCSLL